MIGNLKWREQDDSRREQDDDDARRPMEGAVKSTSSLPRWTPCISPLTKLNSVFDVAYRARFMNIDRRPLMREIDCGTLASSATHQFDPCRFQPRTRASSPAPYNARPTFPPSILIGSFVPPPTSVPSPFFPNFLLFFVRLLFLFIILPLRRAHRLPGGKRTTGQSEDRRTTTKFIGEIDKRRVHLRSDFKRRFRGFLGDLTERLIRDVYDLM